MINRNLFTSYKNEHGQVIIIALFIMVLALGIGITISSRLTSTFRDFSEADNASKAQSIAEAAIEKILLLPSNTLETYITNNNCGADCHLDIVDTNGQHLIADITLSYTGQTVDQPYSLDLTQAQTTEVFLQGYTSNQNVYVCWNTDASLEGQYIYNQSGTVGATPFAYNSVASTHIENNFTTASSLFGYSSCITVLASNTPLALRIKPYYRETEVFVIPAPGYGLPIQGIEIRAVGIVGNARKVITVIKTNSYVPSLFDYVLYQRSETDSLSN